MDDPDAASTNDEPRREPTPPPSAAADVTPPPANKKRSAPPSGGVKDTLESILVAFILAFIFRAFVVEAFVIPTGSMAPTLLGAHMRYTCPDCGYHFDADYRSPGDGDDTDIPEHAGPVLVSDEPPGRPKHYHSEDKIYEVRCPNCGLHLPPDINPRVYYGDRILVLKYIYLLQQPQRWDVVVFKSPYDIDKGRKDNPKPKSEWKFNYAVNYIKRLVGRPNEWVMILDGDIYIAQNENGPWVIQTKPRYAQESLWRIIYDNDYHPLNQTQWVDHGRYGSKWEQPWKLMSGDVAWDTGDADSTPKSRAFTFNGKSGSGTLEFDPSVNRPVPTPAYSDWLAYDQTSQSQGSNTVRDLKLQFDYSRQSGDGPLQLRLSKYGDVFLAELTPSSVKLIHQSRDGVVLGEKTAPLPPAIKGSLHIEFTNVDYRVAVRVNEVDLLETTPAEYHPDVDILKGWDSRGRTQLIPPSAAITARDQQCRLEHISLWRDIFYTPVYGERTQGGSRNAAHLGPDEYFVCGDNSAASLDSRLWEDPINLPDEQLKAEPGRVPGRFLLGRAFFVYWPAGYRPIEKLPGLIPNFGEMRFIR